MPIWALLRFRANWLVETDDRSEQKECELLLAYRRLRILIAEESDDCGKFSNSGHQFSCKHPMETPRIRQHIL